MTDRWREIWSSRSGHEELPRLERALQLDGFDAPGNAITPAHWRAYVLAMATRMRITPGATLFEVGCGAGAFLIPLAEAGFAVGGIDYSPSLIEVGRSLSPSARLEVADAADLDVSEQYDHVFCHSVFQYLPTHERAHQVLTRMASKSKTSVGILDVGDAACRDRSIAARRAYEGRDYDDRYAGLSHLYFERDWFMSAASELGYAPAFYDSDLEGHRNAAHRYSVVLLPTPQAVAATGPEASTGVAS